MKQTQEPSLADGIRDLYERGWYVTFMYRHRDRVERSQSGTELMALFLNHLLKQSVQAHVADELRARCEPILQQARTRGCLFIKLNDTYTSLVLIFNNGIDMQYTRTLGHVRLSKKYGVFPDRVYLKVAVQNFFLRQEDIEPIYDGVPRHRNKLARLFQRS